MDALINVLCSQYNYELLALIWKLGICSKEGEAIRRSISSIIPNLKELVLAYDEEIVYTTPGTAYKKLLYFIKEQNIPLIHITMRGISELQYYQQWKVEHAALKTHNQRIIQLAGASDKYLQYLYIHAAKHKYIPGQNTELDSLLQGETVHNLAYPYIAFGIGIYTFNKKLINRVLDFYLEPFDLEDELHYLVSADHGPEIYDRLYSKYRITLSFNVVRKAAQKGNLKLLKLLSFKNDIVNYAAESGSLEMMEWLYNKGYHPIQETYTHAIQKGHIHVVKWIHSKSVPFYQNILDEVIEYSQPEIIMWLIKQGLSTDSFGYSSIPEVLDYAKKHDLPIMEEDIAYAVGQGRIGGLKWWLKDGREIPTGILAALIQAGDLSELIWFMELRLVDITPDIWTTAAQYGYLDILQWAYKHGYTFCHDIASHGTNKPITDWLHNIGY